MKFLVFILTITLLISCRNNDPKLNILNGHAIGTSYSIHYLDTSNVIFKSKIDSLVKLINKSTSTYLPTSDISKINHGDSTVIIDHFFEEVFRKSKKIYKETDGYFDPTTGTLVNAWGFGPGTALENLDTLKIDSLLNYVGFDKTSIVNGKVIKQHPEIYFDFNAIGKGYLIDIVGRLFEEYNIENYMVEIGGEIRARGMNDRNIPWNIAIENPNSDGMRSLAITIPLYNKSIATSGNYRKFRIGASGTKYVHTINPKTGFATESNLLSASVIAETDCADVDAYATAFMAMGLEKTKAFLEDHTELKVFLIYIDDDGTIKTYLSDGLQ